MKIKSNNPKRMFSFSRYKRHLGVALIASVIGLQSCNENSDPEGRAQLLKTEGTQWVDHSGEKVELRGINIGNWLSMEFWMFDNGDDPLGENIPDQCSLEAKLTERFGEIEKNRIMSVHRDSWFVEEDWDQIAAGGLNVVRVPFPYDVIEEDTNPKIVRENAWYYLDWAIAQAKERQLYVILDLHGAVGRQGWEQHSGCEGQNLLWDNEEYRSRTRWLWGEIAKRYRNEPTVAAYGLLNEPWGTDSETLKDFVVELYDSVREEDKNHIVLLPGHNSDGISAYGDPAELGMTNVAFEAHFYPGIFGWGDIGYKVHRDWLTCGASGEKGVCEWAGRASAVQTPMLVGEMQPWTGLGDLGGVITRASFDTYNKHDWAATAWSYKVTTASGGLGNGIWGFVTNNGNELLVKAQTWGCAGWENNFAEACDLPARSTTPYEGEGTKTMYFVVKSGSQSSLDLVYDEIALVNDADGRNILSGGAFGVGSVTNWTELAISQEPRTYDYSYAVGVFAGSDTGAALRVTSAGSSHSLVYQAVEVQGGQSYTLAGKFKDLGSSNTWAEIYLVPDLPQEGVDVTGRTIPAVNINSSTISDIEKYFTSFSIDEMDYVVNHWVKDAMTAESSPEIFTKVPGVPGSLLLTLVDDTISLSWNGSEGKVEGYKVYRSTSPRSGFSEIADIDNLAFSDSGVDTDVTYYYYVAAYNSIDEGYGSDIVASGETFYTVPVKIEAENFTDAHVDLNIETCSDDGGGFNLGSFLKDRWVEYEINVPAAGDYFIDFRLASQVGDVTFEVKIGDNVLTTVTVPNTMGWQTYETLEYSVTLPEGKSMLRLNSIDDQWNFNWLNIRTK